MIVSRRVVVGGAASAVPFARPLARRRLRGLAGLGAVLGAQEVYDVARAAGFPPDVARQMVAIAKRETGFNSSARCTNCVPKPGGGYYAEDSIGLWQIDMLGARGEQRLAQLGLSSREQLLDPAQNARAAYLLWGGSAANLETLWSINKDLPNLPFKTRYLAALSSLPALSDLEIAYGGGTNNFGCSPDIEYEPNHECYRAGSGSGQAGVMSAAVKGLAVGAGLALVLGVFE